MEFLHTQKKKVLTESGKEMFLRGISIGGWMNLENFINGFPGTEISLREHVVSTLGRERGKLSK